MNQIRAFVTTTMLVIFGYMMLLNPKIAFAQQDIRPEAGKPSDPSKPFITMDEKVASANHIFIGTGRRIYFINQQFKEVAYEEAFKPSKYSTYAILEITVDRTLYSTIQSAPKIALLLVEGGKEKFGDQPIGYDQTVTAYINRSGIYFGEVQTDQIRVDGGNGRPTKVVGEITLHRFGVPYVIAGPKENPLPLTYLQETVQAVNRRIEKEREKVVPAKPMKAIKDRR
jgi:hypothetical protein